MTFKETEQIRKNVAGTQDLRALHSPEFWGRAWAEERNASPYVRRRIRNEQESMTLWSRIAPTYGEHASGKSDKRVANVIELLDRETIHGLGMGPGRSGGNGC